MALRCTNYHCHDVTDNLLQTEQMFPSIGLTKKSHCGSHGLLSIRMLSMPVQWSSTDTIVYNHLSIATLTMASHKIIKSCLNRISPTMLF